MALKRWQHLSEEDNDADEEGEGRPEHAVDDRRQRDDVDERKAHVRRVVVATERRVGAVANEELLRRGYVDKSISVALVIGALQHTQQHNECVRFT